MASKELISGSEDSQSSSSVEIEFALVLSRMIDDVNDDPQSLRQAIYDLARYKLQEQFTRDDVTKISQTQEALEVAIRGVEAFNRQNGRIARTPPQISEANPEISASHADSPPRLLPPQPLSVEQVPIERVSVIVDSEPRRPLGYLAPAAAVIFLLFGLFFVLQQRDRISVAIRSLAKFDTQATTLQPSTPVEASPPPTLPPVATKTSPLLPADYGVYAVSNDTLFELHMLPGRAPDLRVAISPAINTPSQTTLPNGHPKFIVFRRDLVSSGAGQADIRVLAKVVREFKVGTEGKKNMEGEETWVMRNITFPFKSSPVKENPEMYEIHSDAPEAELTPGRYALVLKGAAYDFTIAGNIVDARQCLERIAASNGTFYSECKAP
jgi:hypothetical protein